MHVTCKRFVISFEGVSILLIYLNIVLVSTGANILVMLKCWRSH